MVRNRSPSATSLGPFSPEKKERQPLANISVKMNSPNRSSDQQQSAKPASDIEFGKASPLRNPLHKKPTPNIFAPKSRPQQHIRPAMAPQVPSNGNVPEQRAFHLPGQAPSKSVLSAAHDAIAQQYSRSFEPDVTEIRRPINPPVMSIPPVTKPTFTSTNAGLFYKPAVPPHAVVDLTGSRDDDDEERFDPDAAIRAENPKFGAEDPYMYVDSSKANENIKNLLEGAFDDDEEKGKTRLRTRVKKVQNANIEAKNLADKLASLNVKDEEADKDSEEDEEEDGTVEGLTIKLLPHQVEGVSWMIDKEISAKKTKGVLPHGGILADDMGLGKTIQSVALILTNARPAANAKPEYPKQKLPGKEVGRGTLVVAPLALIKQWESEIESKVTKSHALKVLVHHGPNRAKSSDHLKKYDVVITTYQTLTSEHAASNMGVSDGAKVGCFGVHWYRLILDEAHSIKNRNAKSTQACYALNSWYRWCLTGTPMQNNLDELQSLIKFLRIKPYCELPSWKDQIIQPMKNGRGGLAMRRLQYFLRAFMKRRTKDILKEDGALNFGGKPSADGKSNGGMQIVKREVMTVECDLDKTEQTFYDRLQTRADKRLEDMMEGTGKGDYIGALVLLLRLRQACDHPQLVEMAMARDKDAMTTGGMSLPSSQNAKNNNLDDGMDDLTALMSGVSVQNRTCDVCQVKLSSSEARSGAVRCTECDADLAAVKKSRKEKKQKKKVKEAEATADKRRARTRKIVDSDDEEETGEWIAKEPEQEISLGTAGGTDDEDAEDGGESLNTIDSERSDDETSDIEDSPSRARKHNKTKKETTDENDDDEDGTDGSEESGDASSSEPEDFNVLHGMAPSGKTKHAPSTKVRHLLRILHKESPEHKVIVFSQFTTMLDLIEPHLRASNLRFVRYDGSMRPDAREQSLHSLRTDPKTRVLLCSLKCGSLGLNLTVASRVILVEPFWNPFVEEQAIDRVHRLNQTIDVKVFRLTVRNSVEERILDLQERKRELANAAIEGGNGGAKLSMQDILGLFRRDAEHTGHDDEDREMWERFGSDNRLLDGPNGADAPDHVRDLGQVHNPYPGGVRPAPKKLYQEHDVYGRRW